MLLPSIAILRESNATRNTPATVHVLTNSKDWHKTNLLTLFMEWSSLSCSVWVRELQPKVLSLRLRRITFSPAYVNKKCREALAYFIIILYELPNTSQEKIGPGEFVLLCWEGDTQLWPEVWCAVLQTRRGFTSSPAKTCQQRKTLLLEV